MLRFRKEKSDYKQMCHTNYIQTLFSTIPQTASNNKLQVSMRRSDGELFTANLTMLTADEADKVNKLINYFEELRICSCTRFIVCEKHSSIRKI